MTFSTRFLSAFLMVCFCSVCWAAHDESIDGDLSTDPNNPTALTFSQGSNVISGTVQAPGDTRDYLTFTIAADQALPRLLLLNYTDVSSGGGGDRGFQAIIAGSKSFIPSGGTIGSFLAGAHLDPLPAGTDILPTLATAPQGGTGFSVPLGPGTYTYHVQQTGAELTAYSLEFVVVPEPATTLLVAGLFAPLMLLRRRS